MMMIGTEIAKESIHAQARVSFNSFFPPAQSVQLSCTHSDCSNGQQLKIASLIDVGLQLLLDGGENGETTAFLYESHRMFRFVHHHNFSAASSFLVTVLQPPHGSR